MNLSIEGYGRRMDSREAADTGLLLFRENLGYFLIFFAVPFWVCAFFCRLLPGRIIFFSYLILWWLKPLFDRLILQVISIRFFESGAGFKRLCRSLGKNIFRGLAGDLLWRRFSPLRAVMMPVRMLEFQGVQARKKNRIAERKKNLKNGGIDYCFLLTVWGIAMEIALLTGEILFAGSILGDSLPDIYDLFNGNFSPNSEIFYFTAWCFNYMLVEAIYICMGFSLYINSRVEVEGWDLEIKFKNFAEKYKKKAVLFAFAAVFLLTGIFTPVKALAEDFIFEGKNIPLEELETILKSPDFGGEKETWGIRRKNQSEEQEPQKRPEYKFDIDAFLKILRSIFANTLRIILIALLAALAVILFIFARRMISRRVPKRKQSMITAFNGIPSENPDELLSKSLDFYKQGELRLAWGYSTAAVIYAWQLFSGIIFPPNATENECAEIACETVSFTNEAGKLKTHIKRWINFAYAGIHPAPESYDEAVSLCRLLLNKHEGING